MNEQICPKCGLPMREHDGAVGAAALPMQRRTQAVPAKQWSDPSPYAAPGLKVASSPPTWLDYARYVFYRKAPENFFDGMDGLPSFTVQNKAGYIDKKLAWWISHRWPTATAWQNELGWADEPGNLMWPMFVIWWYGFDSSSRGKHFVKCSGQKPNEFWDPVTLQCVWD